MKRRTLVNIILGMHFEAGLLLWILTAKGKIVKQSFCLSSLEAYLSKAEIFREKKELTLAILNYSQAIKCRPKDADLYFKRGEMYEKTNRVLAIDDYSKVSFMTPPAPIDRFL